MAGYGDQYTDKETEKLQKEIEEVYGQAYKEINVKLNQFQEKFSNKNEKYLNMVDSGKMSVDKYSEWLDGQIFQKEQWESKRDQIIKVMSNANQEATKIINGGLIDTFAENANWTSYTMEHGKGINFGFGLYDKTTVTQLIKDNPDLLPKWKINEKKDYIWNKKKVNRVVSQGIIQGKKLDEITKDLSNKLVAQNQNLMKTFARTAMTGAQNSGRNQSLKDAKDLGINVYKEWMATLDSRTRDSHAAIDGEKQKVGDKWHPFKFSNGCRFPGDPLGPPHEVYNCRCTLVGDIEDYPAEYERHDNIDGVPIKNMTYNEWKEAKSNVKPNDKPIRKFSQVSIGLCKSVQEVNDLLNGFGLWRTNAAGITSEADLTGCDLDSAKSIAAAYEQIFLKYPQLKGKLDAPDAHPMGMKDNTYAWCYIKDGGKVQVNPGPEKYGNWSKIQKRYEQDVISGWHPEGTTAEGIVTHEIGHAIDGLLAREGVLGGVTASGQYRYASSSMKNTVMKRAAKLDEDLADLMEMDRMWKGSEAVSVYVSRYASKNAQEWFAECFAEYITSADPRIVASEFGKELEKLLGRIQ